MASLFDCWSLGHLVGGVALGAVTEQLPTSVAQVMFAMGTLVLWELLELYGRRKGWQGGFLWFMWEREAPENSWIGDIAVGGAGAVLGYSLASHTDVSGGLVTWYYVLAGVVVGALPQLRCNVPGACHIALMAAGIVLWALLGDADSALREQWLMHPLAVVLGSCAGYEIAAG